MFFFVVVLSLLPISYCCGNGYDGLIGTLGIKPGICGFGGYSPGAYGLFFWFIAISLLS